MHFTSVARYHTVFNSQAVGIRNVSTVTQNFIIKSKLQHRYSSRYPEIISMRSVELTEKLFPSLLTPSTFWECARDMFLIDICAFWPIIAIISSPIPILNNLGITAIYSIPTYSIIMSSCVILLMHFVFLARHLESSQSIDANFVVLVIFGCFVQWLLMRTSNKTDENRR